jgi:hypothetical protein
MGHALRFSTMPLLLSLALLPSNAEARAAAQFFFGTAPPAQAPGGLHRSTVPRIPAAALPLRNFHQRRFPRNVAFPGAVLPFFWWPTTQIVASPDNEAPVQPEVVVIREEAPSPAPAKAEAPPDYSYVVGCHPIPNGYHCDTQ